MKNFSVKFAIIICAICIALATAFLSQYQGPKARFVVKNLELKK